MNFTVYEPEGTAHFYVEPKDAEFFQKSIMAWGFSFSVVPAFFVV